MPEFTENIILKNSDGDSTVVISAEEKTLKLQTPEGQVFVELGRSGHGNDGDIFISDKDGNTTIHLGGEDSRLSLGGHGNDGDIFISDKDGNTTIHLGGDDSRLYLGGHGNDGDIFINDKDGNTTIHLGGDDSRLYLGGHGNDGDIYINDKNGNETIHLDGNAGDIILQNADCAEEFSVTNTKNAEPGTVMIIEETGLLTPCITACDSRVIGVVSGAGEYKPAIIMDRNPSQDNRAAIATIGKVFCKVTAEESPIRAGDLLTTSSVPGHAMRLPSNEASVGAVLGKALEPLSSGTSLIPVLVMLR